MQHSGERGEADGEHPRVALAAAYAASEEQQPDPRRRDERRRGFVDGDGHDVAQQVEPVAERRGERREQVDETGDRDDGAGDTPRAAPPSIVVDVHGPVDPAGIGRHDGRPSGIGSGPGGDESLAQRCPGELDVRDRSRTCRSAPASISTHVTWRSGTSTGARPNRAGRSTTTLPLVPVLA